MVEGFQFIEVAIPILGGETARHIFDTSPCGFALVAGPGHILHYFNPALASLLPSFIPDRLGQPVDLCLDRQHAASLRAALARAEREGSVGRFDLQLPQPGDANRQLSHMIWRVADAGAPVETFVIQVSGEPIGKSTAFASGPPSDTGESGVPGLSPRTPASDGTELSHAPVSLGFAQLAGGMAHHFNNILTPVIGLSELAVKSLPEDSKAGPLLEEVVRNARRAADLVAELLASAGKGMSVLELLDVSRLTREMSVAIREAVSINSAIELQLATDLPAIKADSNQIRQLVSLLVNNAADAIGRGPGIVKIRTWSSQAPEIPVTAPGGTAPAGRHVYLQVTDNGSGMSEEVAKRIFEPFFTTKVSSRGMGLAVADGIARGHHGQIQVRTEPGRGSVFTVRFPAVASPVAAPPSERPQDWRGEGTILVVEEDPGIREMVLRVLKQAGLSTLPVRDGKQAQSLLIESREQIHAVILDVATPDPSGLEALAALRRLRPETPAIIISGFSIGDGVRQTTGEGTTIFLQKPFKTAELRTAIRTAINK